MNAENNTAKVKKHPLASNEEREALSHAYKESLDCWNAQQRETVRNDTPVLKPARIK